VLLVGVGSRKPADLPIRMSMYPPSPRRRRRADVLPGRRSRLHRLRVPLPDGAHTTLHVASYELGAFAPQVVLLDEPTPLVRWCREHGVRNALVGGFYQRPEYLPLGQVWIGGERKPSIAFDAPWGERRACVSVLDGTVRIARRDQLDADPPGDLLQAGPLLVAGGRTVFIDGEDVEGFSAAARQFDSDITAGRYPRAALALAGDRLLAVTCDGRTRDDAGMTLGELADTLIGLGACDALNLDGGGSASLVHAGRLRNKPREEHGIDLLEGRAVPTAIVFNPR
jgi:Phosphodiester glycosidase